MANTKYTYNISTDFPNGKVDADRLVQEIRASVIVPQTWVIISDGYCDVWFKNALTGGEKDTLDGDVSPPNPGSLIGAHSGAPLIETTSVDLTNVPVTGDKRLRVAIEKSDTKSKTIFSHNWCDRTTWYEQAVRVVDEVATDRGSQTIYDLTNDYFIDIYHGKISDEDVLVDADGYTYRVSVKVNDTDGYTEQDPHYGSGGDYTVNYNDGYITFLTALDAADVVKVTYHYENGSLFTIKPAAGKKLSIETVEVQFSENVILDDTTRFDAFGLVDVFAPQYTPVPYPSGTLIPIKEKIYKTMADFQNDSLRAYPKYPSLGGPSWRGMNTPIYVFDWDYLRGNNLHSSYGMEIRVFLEHDVPFGGSFATATFYCVSEDE